MAERFQYALLRLVPDLERGERINVGLVLHCRTAGLLEVRTQLERSRLTGLPGAERIDLAAAERQLTLLEAIGRGDATAGPVALLDRSDRFGWLTAPSSTIIQPSAVHTGLCDDPAAISSRLFDRLVR